MTSFNITWSEIFLAVHTTAALACMMRVLYKQKNIGSTFAWLIILFLFPLFGTIAYILIGEPRLGAARAKRIGEMNRFYQGFADQYLEGVYLDIADKVKPHYYGISKVAARATGLGATQSNAMALLSTTDDIIGAMLADIEAAEHSCMLAFYIIDPQGRIKTLLEAVIRAAQRGVDCAILADAVGSSGFFDSGWVERLKEAGVEVESALPVGLWRTLFTRSDLRNHRKILVIDGKTGYTGSFNLADPKFFKKDAGVGQWVDVMMRCTGPMVLEMSAVFFADLAVEDDENLQGIQKYLTEHQDRIPQLLPEKMKQGSIVAQVIPSAPEQGEHVIYETIISAVHAATRRVTITTPYFVPDEPLLTALTVAAKRGVDVTLIVPEKVDSLLVRYASRAYYPMLLASGVKIAAFKGGLLHAKTMTIDEDYALFGTVNMDMRSFFLNLEISLAIYDRDMANQIYALQQQYLADSECISVRTWQQRSKWWGLVENVVRLVSPLL
ncbi:cardiolipin synthase [Neisseria chenwenguii]|uniref:cardiolipin synthase n=1 Tax=Neisseria chenwenguii TaxID=1853278 RepID=UPI000F4DB116|nr:cardiolipin synthase [Neisseria chenwenguii]ROV57405.1 cardiolipin synthase [Neisseria chenwenguii]